jgi:nucleotide-binding universal stress UspA family protein
MAPFKKILVGLDGSAASTRALEHALRLASFTGASVQALSVEERLPAYAATVGEVQETLREEERYFHGVERRSQELAAENGIRLSYAIVPGHATEELVRAAKKYGCDLIVLGRSGHSQLHHALLGSTADRVAEHALCPVLIVN